jgi:hypothetical protein
MTAGSDSLMGFAVGRSDDTRNQGQIVFNYIGAGSTANYLEFGLFAVDNILNLTGAGNVGIGITSPGSRLVVQGSGATDTTSALNITNSTPTSLLFVRNDGNIGIGTTSPSAKFHVNNSGATSNPFYVNTGNTGNTVLFEHTGASTPVPFTLRKSGFSGAATNYGLLYLSMNDNTVGNGSNLYFTLNDSAGNEHEYAGIGGTIRSNTNGAEQGDLFFMTSDNGTTRSEKMRIISNGDVGIGTTGPTSKLSISDGVAMYAAKTGVMLDIKRNVSNGNDTTSRTGIRLGNNSNAFDIYYGGTTDRLRFLDGGNGEVMSLINGGNVGIGNTSPGSRLVVQGSGTTSATSALNVTNSTPTSLLFVRDDGNVGIGTSSPLYPVVIANRGPSGTPQRSLAIGNTATNGTFMYLGSSASTSGYNLIQSVTTEGTDYGNLVLQPEAGNVGVATISPSAKLHVNGTVRIDSTSSQPNTVAHNVELLYTNTATDNIAMGEPDVWLQININGTVYAIPAYVPA